MEVYWNFGVDRGYYAVVFPVADIEIETRFPVFVEG